MYRRFVLRSLLTCATSIVVFGCSSRQFTEVPNTTPVVPVAAVINSLKCGLSNAIELDTLDRSGIRGATAAVTLKVNVVEGVKAGGKVSAGIPVATGATFTPAFGASREHTQTSNSTIDFNLLISGNNKAACAAAGQNPQDSGFSTWLGQIVADVNQAVAGPPQASIVKYTYDSHFVVRRSATAGFEFEIVPVKLGASVDQTRSDIQHITIEINAVRIVDGKPAKGGGKPFGFPAQPPRS